MGRELYTVGILFGSDLYTVGILFGSDLYTVNIVFDARSIYRGYTLWGEIYIPWVYCLTKGLYTVDILFGARSIYSEYNYTLWVSTGRINESK